VLLGNEAIPVIATSYPSPHGAIEDRTVRGVKKGMDA